MEFYRIWRILAGNKWLLIWLPTVATLVGLGLTYVLPEQYESTALVLVRPFEDIRFNTGGGGDKQLPDFPVNLSAPIDAPSKTYVEVIKSEAVATRIVQALHLDVPKPRTDTSWLGVFKDNLKDWIKSTIRTTRNYFKYGRDIPATPFELAVEDVEDNLIVTPRKDTYAFDIAFRSGDPKEAAAVANMAAEIFLQQSSDAYRAESKQASDFNQTQVEAARQTLAQARAAILAYKTAGGTFALTSEYDERLKELTDLQNTLAKDASRLAGLKVRTYTAGSPDVMALEAEIAELKVQIAALQDQLATYPQKETNLDAMLLNERVAKDNYEFFLKQYNEARVKESDTVSEIRIVSHAEPSLYPVKPLKYMYAGIALLTGLVVAIAWALFVEMLDPRVRTIQDIETDLGVPVLGTIPKLSGS